MISRLESRNVRAISRMLIPSRWALRTLPYSSTVNILASCRVGTPLRVPSLRRRLRRVHFRRRSGVGGGSVLDADYYPAAGKTVALNVVGSTKAARLTHGDKDGTRRLWVCVFIRYAIAQSRSYSHQSSDRRVLHS